MKSGKVIKGRLAMTFVNLGLAVVTSIRAKSNNIESLDNANEDNQVVRKRRTKAEIEAEKKNKK